MLRGVYFGMESSVVSQKYLRTYEDVINTKPCYSEVLFYKVDKYVNNIIGDPVQTYWVSMRPAKHFNRYTN